MNLMELFVKIGVQDEASDNISGIAHNIGKGLATAGKIGAAAVGAVTTATVGMATAFVGGASNVAQYGDNIDKMSQKMGLSAEAYQEWDFIMQHSGTSMEALKAGMKTLANAVDSENAAFGRLGISQEEIANLNQEELFAKTIEQLQKVDNETERTYLAGQLLGRGATELGALLNTSAEDTEAMRQQVHELGGVMSNEAVKSAAGFQDSLQNMQTAFSGISRSLLSDFLPSMTQVMDGLAAVFSGDSSGVSLISEGIQTVVDNISEKLPQLFEIGASIITTLATALIDNLPSLTKSAAGILLQLTSAFIEALPQIVEVGLQILTSLINGIVQALPTLIPTIVSVVLTIVQTILDNLPLFIEAALQIIVALTIGIINAIPELVSRIPEIITAIVVALVGAIPQLATAALQIAQSLGQMLYDALPEPAQKAVDSFVQGFQTVLQKAQPILDGIKDGFVAAWNAIKSVWEAVQPFFSTLFETIKTVALPIIDAIKTTFIAAWEAIKVAWDVVVGFFQFIWDAISGIFSVVENVLKGDFEAAWNAIKGIWDSAVGFFSTLWDGIKEIFSIVEEWFGDIFEDAVEAVKAAWDGITQWFSDLWDDITGVFSGAWEWFKGIGSNIVDGIKNGISSAWEGLSSWVGGLWDGLTGLFGGGKDKNDITTAAADQVAKSVNASSAEGSMAAFGGVVVNQNIYSNAQTAADLMEEAMYQQRRAAYSY